MFFSGQQLLLKYLITTLALVSGVVVCFYADPYPYLWLGGYLCVATSILIGVTWGNQRALLLLREGPKVEATILKAVSAWPYCWISHEFSLDDQQIRSEMLLAGPATRKCKALHLAGYKQIMGQCIEGNRLNLRVHPKDPQQHYIEALIDQALMDSRTLIHRLIFLLAVAGFFSITGYVNIVSS